MFKKFKVIASNKPTVGVFGANGNVGRATVAALSYYFSSTMSIRAIVRNPSVAKDLADLKGVHVVAGEVGRNDCSPSLTGLSSVFIIPPSVEDRISRMKVTLQLAKDCHVEHIVTISVTVADDTNTQFGKEFAELESFVTSLGVPFSILRLPIFIDNFWIIKSTLPKIRLTLEKDKFFTPVVIADIGVAAAFLSAQYKDHPNKYYTITSDRLSIDLFVQYLIEALNLEVIYEKISVEESKELMLMNGIQSWQIDGTLELAKLINEENPCLDQKENHFQLITNQEPTKVKEWINNVKEYFLS